MHTHTSQRGFVALISVIIIAAVLLLVVASSGLTSFYSRFNTLDAELKARSEGVADACVDYALVQLALGSDPSGSTLSLNAIDECRIGAMTGSSQITFRVQATSSDQAVTNLQIVVNGGDLSVVSWAEIATF
ncbi:hypothetical protein FJY93_03915 [Candidatus Kaiserbacteria bacterium]|nr:hypothetical protein [Candidatus Kaiserbacteria bacterium]